MIVNLKEDKVAKTCGESSFTFNPNDLEETQTIVGIGLIRRHTYEELFVDYNVKPLLTQKIAFKVYQITFESPSGVIYKTPYLSKYDGIFDDVTKRFISPSTWAISKVAVNVFDEFCKHINTDIKMSSEFNENEYKNIILKHNLFINKMLVC
jgi:hypothetical protein